MANRTTRNAIKDTKFFEALASGKPVRIALAESGYKRQTVYEWREADPEFARRWREAVEEAIERLEAEADRRGFAGIDKPVYYQGQRVDTIREFSDTLAIFRLKALAPDKYRERVSTEFSGPNGGPVRVIIERDHG